MTGVVGTRTERREERRSAWSKRRSHVLRSDPRSLLLFYVSASCSRDHREQRQGRCRADYPKGEAGINPHAADGEQQRARPERRDEEQGNIGNARERTFLGSVSEFQRPGTELDAGEQRN